MCTTCGCDAKGEARILNLQTGVERLLRDDHTHDHVHPHRHGSDDEDHSHAREHRHTHPHHHGDGHVHGHAHGHEHGHSDDQAHAHDVGSGAGGDHHDHHHADRRTVVDLEADVLAKNDRLAARNRGWFEGREILALNIVSSPGAGKTTLLERTIRDLRGELPMFVIEGDQATANDGERIRAAGAAAVQVNTGAGCHLEADMIAKGLEELKPPAGSVVLIENVGNLVCPALFDLGERAKVVVFSVAEGDDKPLKYPHMFRAAELLIINKTDLLPYVDFNPDVAIANARQVNPSIEAIGLSATGGDGIEAWYEWLRRYAGEAREQSFRGLEDAAAPAR
jgi:hydrogenase nickel incorporation protein HypB